MIDRSVKILRQSPYIICSVGFPKKNQIYLFNQKRKKSGGNGVDEDFFINIYEEYIDKR